MPHFIVDPSYAPVFGGGHEDIHHRAHALSPFSLFAYLQVVVLVGAGLFLLKVKAPQILGQTTFSSSEIISLTNKQREANGLGDLTYNPLLAAAASAKAANMFAEDYWAHYAPSGKTPWDFITKAGYRYIYAGENLARDFDSAPAVVSAWMASPSHRSNILDKNFKDIGVAVAWGKLTGHEGILVVQEFGSSVSSSQSTVQRQSVKGESEASTAATPSAQTVSKEVQEIPADQVGVNILATKKFSLAKGISLALIAFIFLLFAMEAIITFRHEKLRVRPAVIAHLAILAFVLFALWYAVGGAIL